MRGRLRYRFLRWVVGYAVARPTPQTATQIAQRCHEQLLTRPAHRTVSSDDPGIAAIIRRLSVQGFLGPYRSEPLWERLGEQVLENVTRPLSIPLEGQVDDQTEEFNRYAREDYARLDLPLPDWAEGAEQIAVYDSAVPGRVVRLSLDRDGIYHIEEIHDTGEEVSRSGPDRVRRWNEPDAEYYRTWNPRYRVDTDENGVIRDHPAGRPGHPQVRVGPVRQWTGPARCQGRYCTCPACMHEGLLREAERRRQEQEIRWSYDPRYNVGYLPEPYTPEYPQGRRYEDPSIMRYIPPLIEASRPPGDGRDRYNMRDIRHRHVYLGSGNRLGPHCHLSAKESPGRYAIQRQIPLGGWITLAGKDAYDTSGIAVSVAQKTSETHDYPTRVIDKNLHEAVWPEDQKGAKC